METALEILQVTVILLVGTALRFMLPYAIKGLEMVGKANSWNAWPEWEWRYLTGALLSLIFYGVAILTIPGAIAELIKIAPLQLMAYAYTGQDILRRIVKPFQQNA